MIEPETLKILEFDKIRLLLAGKSLTPAGKELALGISPIESDSDLNRRLDETTEMAEIISFEEPFPLQRVDDADRLLAFVSTEGTFLDPEELLKLKIFLEICGRLRKYVKNKAEKYPLMAAYLLAIKEQQEIINAIDSAIDSTGEVKDSASPALRRIRIEKGSIRNKVLNKLESMIRSRATHGSRQDDLVTIRDGRYVIPVAENDFTSRSGVVHDRSKSGATLFVEPMETVELNNKLRKLDSDEEKEIERILLSISDLVRTQISALDENYRIIAVTDFIHTRGVMSIQLDANRPSIVAESRLRLVDARHPLLLLKAANASEVVPMTLSLGGKYDALVVTGPNTGGKTVALKTLGLLTLMARSGLHVPADKESEVGSIHRIFADIGDEQSIELSLSTFSSHLARIIHAVENCDSHTLILLDEIGAGTDPKEGSALGESILKHILQRESMAFVTTHYSALKTLPEKYPRIGNASLEFDRETLKPTYRFRVGLPGSSYAIEIARRLGMPRDIVDNAESLVDTQERSLGNLLEKLEVELKESRKAKISLVEQKNKLEADVLKLNDREAGLRKREENLKRKEVDESSALVDQTRRELEELVKEIREKQADKGLVKEAHARIRDLDESFEQKRSRLEPRKRLKTEDLCQGDSVWVETLQTSGELLQYISRSKSWKVQIGSMVSTVRSEFLSRINEGDSKPALPAGVNYAPFEDISPQVSVIGMTVEEAKEVVERLIDRASVSNLETIYILHGKGTGALRRGMKEYLSKHNIVKDFRLGYVGEGSSGVTVVTLKRD
ncbi:MAG: endonuclease MutS2 [candidate division Zixibacteria bacterium]|nr:endonuclease MutS2 [candidate division Zixibacteria bacterium]MBU1471224.1 endonuclease MutS2 [candidate division Zixibacteria bacterium]MBU2623956.1 endonuclease MutS2 [candidate division Zixibacteria bacterium]